MLKQTHSLLLYELIDHITKYCAHRVKTLIGLTDVCKADIVKQYLLDDEDGYSLAQLRSSLHDAQAEWNDLRSQEEINNLR